MDKFLKFLFIILLVITLGEIGYYLYIYNSPKPPAPSALTLDNVTRSLVGQDVAISPSSSSANIKSPLLDMIMANISQSGTYISLNRLSNKTDMNLYISKEQIGLIGNITYDEKSGKSIYEIIDVKDRIKITSYYLNDVEAKSLKIYKESAGSLQLLNYKNIKVGDKIRVIQKENILKPEEAVSVEFVIYD